MKDKHRVPFMTWNIYQGFDPTPLFATPPELVPDAVTQILRQFLANNFPVRVEAIARAIARKKPVLIGLQEAVRVRLIIPSFGTVTYDFIELLIEALKRQGLKYKVAACNHNVSISLPDSIGNTVDYLDRDAILILKGHKLNVISKQEENYQTNLTIPIGGQPFTILRGWSAIDVKIHGRVFRMINTHLDPIVEAIRDAQAAEVIQGPANTNIPVVITGDLNSVPNSSTYNLFSDAGFRDTWNEAGEGPGFTSEQSPDLLNADSMLNRRIDYILFRKSWKPMKARLVGEMQQDRTTTGLWPSDHAGVYGKLKLN